MTLMEFLLQRIAEDEAATDECLKLGANVGSLSIWVEIGSDETDAAGTLGERFSPARVLAECEAKRRIVTRCEAVLESWSLTYDVGPGQAVADVIPAYPDVTRREKSHAYATMTDLASVYADHPDCQEEWT